MNNLYFNHSYSLRNQTEILELRAEFGIEGYGLYLMLLETIAESETQSINKNLVKGLSLNLNCEIELLKEVINFCVKLNLFFVKHDFIFSKHLETHFAKRAEIKEKRSKAGAKGGKSKANAKQMLSNSKQSKLNKTKEIKENKINKTNKEKIKEFFENENLRNLVEKKLVPYENQVWWSEQANSTIQEIKEGMLIFYEKKPPIKNMKLTFYTWLNKKDRKLFYKYKKTSENEYNAPLTTNYNDDLTPEEEKLWNEKYAEKYKHIKFLN